MKNPKVNEEIRQIGENAYQAAKAAAIAAGKTPEEAQVLAAQARLDAMKQAIENQP